MSSRPSRDDSPSAAASRIEPDSNGRGERSVGEIREQSGGTVWQLKRKYGQLLEQRDSQIRDLVRRQTDGHPQGPKRRMLIVADAKSMAETVGHYLEGCRLELELDTARGLICGQNERIEQLTENLDAAKAELAAAKAALAGPEAENRNLVQANERAQREAQTLGVRIESLQEELERNREALRQVRTATLRAAGRVLEQSSGG